MRQRRTAVRFFSRHAPRYTGIPVNRDSPTGQLVLMHNATASTIRMFFLYVLLNYGIEVRERCRENALYSVKISFIEPV